MRGRSARGHKYGKVARRCRSRRERSGARTRRDGFVLWSARVEERPSDRVSATGDNARRVKRVRRHRPPSLTERVSTFIANPRLRKRQRLERLAIIVAILFVGLYLIASPLVSKYFPSAPKSGVTTKAPPGKAKKFSTGQK